MKVMITYCCRDIFLYVNNQTSVFFFVLKYTNVRIIALDLLLSYEFTRLLFAQQFITNFFLQLGQI